MEKKIIFELLLSGQSCAQSKGDPELAHPIGSIKPHGNVWAPSSARDLCAQQTAGGRAALSAQQPGKPLMVPNLSTSVHSQCAALHLFLCILAIPQRNSTIPPRLCRQQQQEGFPHVQPGCSWEPNHCSSSKDALPRITAVGTGRGAQCCVPLLHHLTARFNECLCWSALIAVILQGLEVLPLTFYLQTAPSFPRVIRG